MPVIGSRIDQLRIRSVRPRPMRLWLWREWCFLRMVVQRFWLRLIIIAVVIAACSAFIYFRRLPEGDTPIEALYLTWSYILGQIPGDVPADPVMRTLVFLMPVVGLTVVIHAIVELSEMMRDRRRNERSWCTMMASSLSNHIILVGLGKLGYRSYQLLRKLGETVVVIERDPDKAFLEEIRRDGSPLLLGDARQDVILTEANVAAARSIILATNDDLANLEVALDARRFNPKIRVVLRMFDQNMADKIGNAFDIHVCMSQSAISAPAFALGALDAAMTDGFVLDDQLIVMRETTIVEGEPLAGLTIGDVLTRYGFSVVRHRPRGGNAGVFPNPQTRLATGDELLIQGPFDALGKIGRGVSC